MRICLEGWFDDVNLVGARRVVLPDGRHIGAIIDDEDETYIVGPLVHDRPESKVPESYRHATGRSPAIPISDSISDRDFAEAHLYLEALAKKVDLPFRTGRRNV